MVIELPVGLVGREAFPGNLKYADVIESLDRAGYAWQPYTPLTFDNQCAVQATSSGVVFVFEVPEGEDPVLNVMGPRPTSMTAPRSPRPPRHREHEADAVFTTTGFVDSNSVAFMHSLNVAQQAAGGDRDDHVAGSGSPPAGSFCTR
ncbi:hypothetical protein ABZX90_43405 [Streptomyces sp. NPDC002935]|uniref:hypothetical protein n=1 Tax=unclassified Streptomyces TaxID=2593676 RepID=UPI003318500E